MHLPTLFLAFQFQPWPVERLGYLPDPSPSLAHVFARALTICEVRIVIALQLKDYFFVSNFRWNERTVTRAGNNFTKHVPLRIVFFCQWVRVCGLLSKGFYLSLRTYRDG